jgi:DNA mismatch repair protein MutL
MQIKPLSEDLQNKIAAGEVVERPASVVKELVENSLDANAKTITIVVEQGGEKLIQVTDDGSGIPSEELTLAVQRYTTSKIEEADDLFNIQTLGFRGEGLASIAAVAEIELASFTNEEGHTIKVKNGQAGAIEPAAGVRGTQVTVRNLFYNTPARKKFLKKPRTEFRKIVDMVRRFSLMYPENGFKLISENRNVLDLKSESLEDRISAVTDPLYKNNILSVSLAKGDYLVTGFVGNLTLVRKKPGEQFLFLNRRFIHNRMMNSAVYNAFRSLINRGEYPFFVINLSLPFDQVDVNVHPMKTEVRFKDEWRLYHVVRSAAEQALEPILSTIPDFSAQEPGISFFANPTASEHENQASMGFGSPIELPQLDRAKSYASNLAGGEAQEESFDFESMWQVHKKYIVSQIQSGLVIIDQHVAHERVLFEEALASFDGDALAAQTLLFPEVEEFSPDDFSVLLEILPYLEKMGFRMKEFGETSVMVEAIPSEMAWGTERLVIKEMIDNYQEYQKKHASFQEALAASFACHAAVKAGDQLTHEEMSSLVNRLFGTEHPYYCPHGRPVIIQLSLDELDQRFERS